MNLDYYYYYYKNYLKHWKHKGSCALHLAAYSVVDPAAVGRGSQCKSKCVLLVWLEVSWPVWQHSQSVAVAVAVGQPSETVGCPVTPDDLLPRQHDRELCTYDEHTKGA